MMMHSLRHHLTCGICLENYSNGDDARERAAWVGTGSIEGILTERFCPVCLSSTDTADTAFQERLAQHILECAKIRGGSLYGVSW